MSQQDKAKQIGEKTEAELKFAVDGYMAALTPDMKYNSELYDIIESDWKKYAQRINNLQKLIVVSPFAFRDEITNRIKILAKK